MSGYRWHRQEAFANLSSKNGLVKRAQWLTEVRNIYNTGVPWREALRTASSDRKRVTPDYKTFKTKVVESYKGRNADTVKCSGVVCPGRYNKQPATVFRPQGHPNKRVLTQSAAVALLKDYYNKRGALTGRLVQAQRAMKKDISTKRANAVNPCPVKTITENGPNGKTRKIAVRDANCADSWLYRKSMSYDMVGVDHGNKK